jgi:hypothetical protein
MNRKKEKSTYGNSQGSNSSDLSSELRQRKSSTSSAPQYAQSGDFTDRKSPKNRSLRSNSVMLDSLPRTIFKVGIIGLILYPLLVYTPIGKSITTRGYLAIAEVQKKIAATQSEVNLKTMAERKQKVTDDRFNDRLKQAGDDSAKKDKDK